MIEKIAKYIPSIKPSIVTLTTKERVLNTLLVIVIYAILSSIYIFGLDLSVTQRLAQLAILFGSNLGTLTTLGIGPIVLSSILLQLLIGMGILSINLTTEDGKRKYNLYYRFFAIVFIILEAFVLLLSGTIIPNYSLDINPVVLHVIIFLQLFVGGIIILLLDDFSSKYGITSGINVMIFTSISIALFIRLFGFSIIADQIQYTGELLLAIDFFLQGNTIMGLVFVSTILFTFIIIYLSAYLSKLKIEIPLLYVNIRGETQKFPINVLYTSVIPVIFIYAIIVQIQHLFGFDNQNIIVRMLNPPRLLLSLGQYGVSYILDPLNIIHIFVYLLIFTIGGMLLSLYWIYALGLDPNNLAKQITENPAFGLYSRDPRIIKEDLEKYIKPVGYLSGIFVGFLAAISDIVGTVISGISILLLVLIANQLYQDLEKNGGLEYVPIIGKYLKK